MPKFDIDKAKAGHPVLWDGKFPCTIHDFNFNGNLLCAVGHTSQKYVRILTIEEADLYLSLATIKKTAWVAINPDKEHFKSNKDCLNYIKNHIPFPEKWKSVKIEWEE